MNVSIIGGAGAFGQWFARFFAQKYAANICIVDPAIPTSASLSAAIVGADVVLFCTPTRITSHIIDQAVSSAHGKENNALWMDITSIKSAPIAAMKRSKANVLGLHPMCAAPSAPTMRGKVLITDKVRLDQWRDWVEQTFLPDLEASCIECDAERHDRHMALIQGVVHANHLAQFKIAQSEKIEPETLWQMRSPAFSLSHAISSRILSSNPDIYQDIQFDNPYVLKALRAQHAELSEMIRYLESGKQADRTAWLNRYYGGQSSDSASLLKEAHHLFEHLSNLVSDCAEANDINFVLTEDKPGTLRRVLEAFEQEGLNLRSIHSSRNLAGEVVFRVGLEADNAQRIIEPVLRELINQNVIRLAAL